MRSTLLLPFVGIVTLAACGGGGGSATDTILSPPPPAGISGTFLSDELTPDNKEVTVRQESAAGSRVTLQVNVTATKDVYAAGFDLTWDPTRVAFQGWTKGSLLEEGGYVPLYSVQQGSGRLSVGITRAGAVPGALVDRGTLIKLTFTMLRGGPAPVRFANTFLLDSQPPGPSPIPDMTWHAGRFEVTAPGG